jgi:hypothetical protein
MDQPYNALAMITAFTRGQPLQKMDSMLLVDAAHSDKFGDKEDKLLERIAEGPLLHEQKQSVLSIILWYAQDVMSSSQTSESTA